MSSFRRTSSGLNNQHLFYKVDIVVFVEGGQSYSKSDVYLNKFTNETEDVIFWKNVFKKFRSTKRFKFKSIGSKTVVKEIALDIIKYNISTVIVAMDNEFDEILNKRIDHPNIYYTNGYSFENDIWNVEIIKNIIEELSAIQLNDRDIDLYFKKFLRRIRLAVYADAYLFKKGSSFFPRSGGNLFCVDCNPTFLPEVKTIAIENKILKKGLTKGVLYSFGSRYSIDPLKYCYGHFLADFCYQLIYHYLRKKHSINNLSKDIVHRMGINKFFQIDFSKGKIYDHYYDQFLTKIA